MKVRKVSVSGGGVVVDGLRMDVFNLAIREPYRVYGQLDDDGNKCPIWPDALGIYMSECPPPAEISLCGRDAACVYAIRIDRSPSGEWSGVRLFLDAEDAAAAKALGIET